MPLPRRRIGFPLGMQLLALLACTLVAAQFVTLVLAVLFPPQPTSRWNLAEVARGIAGGELSGALERQEMKGPPDLSEPGWMVSETARSALARELGRPDEDVILAFYTQLPVGGMPLPPPPPGDRKAQPLVLELLVGTAHAQAVPGGPPPGGMPGGFPGGMPPGGSMPRLPSPPQGTMRSPQGAPRTPAPPTTAQPNAPRPAGVPQGSPAGTSAGAPGNAPGMGTQPRPGTTGPAQGPAFTAPGAQMQAPRVLPAAVPTPAPVFQALPSQPLPRVTDPRPNLPAPVQQAKSAAAIAPEAPLPAPQGYTDLRPASTTKAVSAPTAAGVKPQPLPFRQERSGLAKLVSPQFIEGDFIAAARQSDGRWIAVAPRAEPFPNRWQRQLLMWFVLSLAIISPLAWMMARRIVRPLEGFARAAETLGRDPSAKIIPLSGPAEIGRAANAFNQMRSRLGAFVDDRTAMVGAISHDLRTPLTRLRFRIEDVPDKQREGLLKEVTEMEQMISQVIAFIRDASTPGPRELVDLAELVESSVADARLVGGDVSVERLAHVPVEVDPVGMRRLLGNLLENAMKYGVAPRVRVSLDGNEAVAEIVDQGPGIPEAELDRAFEPFFRSESARRSGKPGSGLGLAVCRSIARAHGGEVALARGAEGFVARVTMPVAIEQIRPRAA